MRGAHTRTLIIATVLMTLCVIGIRGETAFAGSPTAAGTKIVNAASATWQDSNGDTFNILSNDIVVTVEGVSALTVTPKETAANPSLDGYPQGQPVTRTFIITNVSNIADAYKITSFAADKGSVTSLSFVESSGLVPVTLNSTVSQTIQPGQSLSVQATIATTGIAIGTQFALHLTAQTTVGSTANGLQSDSGEQWLVTGEGPTIAGPGGATTPISKTVNSSTIVQSQAGATVTFDVTVKNYGGTPATNAVMTDVIPTGLTADPSSVKINGTGVAATLSGQTLTVPIGTIGAGVTDDISFNAQILNATSLGSTFVNTASVSADGIPAMTTTPAAVLIGTADIVFDPANGNAPVGGATVSLLDANNNLLPLTASSATSSRARTPFASVPSTNNTSNPFVTGADGVYGFALQASQIAAAGTTFYITITTPGYLNRRIKVFVTPSSDDFLYNIVATSEDGQPLAVAGGYTLTSKTVALNNIFGLFGNLPLFKTQVLTIDKTADRAGAQPGDRVVYQIVVSNASGNGVQQISVIDTLPSGEAYATGSGRVGGVPQEPAVNGRTLTWTLPAVLGGSKDVITYACVIYPNVPAGTTLTNSVTANGTVAGTRVGVNAAANAQVLVVDGALSDRAVITGRVFVDAMRTGHFVRGDTGIAGARVFMEDGTSVTTDRAGRFSFASVRPGMHVLRVDKTTLPPGASGMLQRLIHGVLDDGLMQDVEFAVNAP